MQIYFIFWAGTDDVTAVKKKKANIGNADSEDHWPLDGRPSYARSLFPTSSKTVDQTLPS